MGENLEARVKRDCLDELAGKLPKLDESKDKNNARQKKLFTKKILL